jgi:hypothetical protein
MRKTSSVALALGMSLLSIWALGASGPVGAAPPMPAAAATVPGSVWAQQPSGTHETLAGVTCPSSGMCDVVLDGVACPSAGTCTMLAGRANHGHCGASAADILGQDISAKVY